MSDISANRTDLVGDPSRGAGNLPADAQGQQAARDAQAAALPTGRPSRPAEVVRPSARPNEPVTAGLPIGAGPAGAGLPPRGSTTMETYRALLRRTRDPQLAVLLGRMAERQR